MSDIDLFRKIWKGGYFGGDPLDPIYCREYGDLGLISVNHAVYRAMVEPWITPETNILEIGPGRGAWTRGMLKAKHITCLDVLSAEHNKFWEYVGEEHRSRIDYHEVSTADLDMVADDSIDFLFSFGVFCHVYPELQDEYLRNAFAKAKSGAMGVIMFANFDKSNKALDDLGRLRAVPVSLRGFNYSLRYNVGKTISAVTHEGRQDKNDTTPRPGRFFHRDVEEFAATLEAIGWQVITADVNLNHRDPVAWFKKP